METKAQDQITSLNVQRKLKAAAAWCERINSLPEAERGSLAWHYVLLGEMVFKEWRDKGRCCLHYAISLG